MALGTVITLGLDFSGPNVRDLPVVSYVDPIEAPGSLLLLDMTHPLSDLGAGAPVHGNSYPNLFATKAAPLLNTSDTSLSIVSVFAEPSHGKVERSRMGGIHVIQSVTQDKSNAGFQLRLPAAIVDYFKANHTHQFYVSQWGKTTRAESSSQHSVGALSGSTAFSFAWTLADSNTVGGGPTKLGLRAVAEEVAGVTNFRNVGVTNFGPDFRDAVIQPQSGALFEVGNFLVPNAGNGKRGLHGAQIFYRGYIEDLTVSGRTYAEVDAIDYAEYTKQVLTAGGRYYGDTVPTDPSVLP